jgi:hypothetical protein
MLGATHGVSELHKKVENWSSLLRLREITRVQKAIAIKPAIHIFRINILLKASNMLS